MHGFSATRSRKYALPQTVEKARCHLAMRAFCVAWGSWSAGAPSVRSSSIVALLAGQLSSRMVFMLVVWELSLPTRRKRSRAARILKLAESLAGSPYGGVRIRCIQQLLKWSANCATYRPSASTGLTVKSSPLSQRITFRRGSTPCIRVADHT
jgi:hypothetical protein